MGNNLVRAFINLSRIMNIRENGRMENFMGWEF